MANQIVFNKTLLDTVKAVATRVGFATTVATAAGATDPAILQFVTAVNDALADMIGEFQWPDFIVQSTMSIQQDAPGQVIKQYALPDDFFSFIQRTQNDKTALWPTYNAINSQTWQALQTIAVGVTIQIMWRYRAGKLEILYPPSNPHTWQFEYLSCGYVKDADDPTSLKNYVSKDGDTILFDSYLVELYATAKWKEIKGFDTTTAMAAFARAYDQRFNRQQTAEVVSLVGGTGPYNGIHLIDAANLPMTGYGST